MLHVIEAEHIDKLVFWKNYDGWFFRGNEIFNLNNHLKRVWILNKQDKSELS